MTNYEILNNAINKLDTFVEYNHNNWESVPVKDINLDKKIILNYINKGLVVTWSECKKDTKVYYFITDMCFKTRKCKEWINEFDLIDRKVTETNVKFNKNQLDLIPNNAIIKTITNNITW